YDGKIVTHAHNDYVEALADTGIAGGLCCAAFLLTLIITAIRRIRRRSTVLQATLQMGALVSCAGLLVHSLVDFNLHIPSNALLFFLMAGFASVHIAPARRAI